MNNLTITNTLYQERLEVLEGMAIDALWGVSCPNEDIGNVQFPFEEKRTYFFELLERFMTEGKVRIGKHGKFLDGSIEEQISRYSMAFPKTEDEWKKRNEEIWFYEEDCPGGIVWIHENGYEDWT